MRSTKKLYRSRYNKMFAGVCGGIADYLDFDVSFVRLFFVLLSFMSGIGIVLYLVFLFIMPIESKHKDFLHVEKSEIKNSKSKNIFGFILIFFGLLMLINCIVPILNFVWNFSWSLLIVVLGIYLLLKK